MPLIALVCAGLLGLADDGNVNPPASDQAALAAEYRQAKAASGRTPDDQVRLALWCEAHGLTAERMRHLALALLADPANATARGLSGLVSRDGKWVAPDSVAQAVRTDPATSALLAEYDTRRSKTPYNADAQWALGLWADKQGLNDQAKAHFTAVTRLDPAREVAWNRLGYKKHGERWATDAQDAAAKFEAEAQKRADRMWRPLLEGWKAELGQPSKRDAAQAALLGMDDSRAFRSIWAVFGEGGAANQAVAVQLLGQIDGGPASLALTKLSVRGESAEVRRAALETLALRDPRDCLGWLIPLIKTPWKYDVRPSKGRGSLDELFIEGERYNVRRVLAPAPPVPGRPIRESWNGQIALNNDRLAQQAFAAGVREVKNANSKIRSMNDRVLPVLIKITGQDLGENHQAWTRWDTERVGYAFQSPSWYKPTFTEVIDPGYQEFPTPPHTACFGAGTPVRTIDGTRLIEKVQRGDLVLVQDTTSGALSYQAVITAFHNPPSATYRVKLGEDSIVATGIHRFWRAGKGWAMARDLKPGDLIRTLGGVATVEAVSPEVVQPVFNLEVAEGRSFFVGRSGALVHDNSLVEATPSPFDAARPRDAVASTITATAR